MGHGGRFHGVGVGWRPELAADLLRAPATVDFVEVVAESCFVQGRARREALALTALWPVVPHGVKLSLGSAEGIEVDRAARLGRLCRDLRAPLVTEHVAFVRAGGAEIGHLTQLPRTREAVRVVARNVAATRRHLPDVPLLLENVAWSVRWPDDAMTEPDFHAAIAEATGCDLLLDVGNLFANATNEGLDPGAILARYPLDRVAMLHVAGGVLEDGFYFDTHADPVPDAVFALVDAALQARPGIPVVLERDAAFPAFPEIAGELNRLRQAGRDAAPTGARAGLTAARAGGGGGAEEPGPDRDAATSALAAAQASLAALLVAPADAGPGAAPRFDLDALRRARAILRRKRIDDALPLLAHLAAHRAIRAIAARALEGRPRARRGTAIADAFAIARAAADEPGTASAASRDLLLLRARFAGSGDGSVWSPRRLPFVGRERLARGGALWATKGPGAHAPVHLRERNLQR